MGPAGRANVELPRGAAAAMAQRQAPPGAAFLHPAVQAVSRGRPPGGLRKPGAAPRFGPVGAVGALCPEATIGA
eukprot:3632552-Lingulodinium_polyedra.AAC.1